MATQYHVSAKGTVEICRAKVRPCPLGGSHFDNKEQAYAYLETKYKTIDEYETHILYETKYKTIEANKRSSFVESETDNAIKGGKETSKMYYDKEADKWEEHRAIIHEQIQKEIMEKYKDVPSERKAIFSAGLPGAGKTTVLTRYENLNMDEWATVSSDDIKEMLAEKGHVPEIEGLTPMEASTLVHGESSYLANKVLSELAKQGKNVIYDFTCKKTDSAEKRMALLSHCGYKKEDMQFVFVDISPNIAKERAKYRYMVGLNEGIENEINIKKGGSTKTTIGGRHLPQSAIDDSKSKDSRWSSRNAEAVIELHEELNKELPKPKIYDNSGSEPINIDYKDFLRRLPALD